MVQNAATRIATHTKINFNCRAEFRPKYKLHNRQNGDFAVRMRRSILGRKNSRTERPKMKCVGQLIISLFVQITAQIVVADRPI